MIKELQKTYEYLPKQDNEGDRYLLVTSYMDFFKIKLIIYINGLKYTALHRVSKMELMSTHIELEDMIIIRLCRKLQDKFKDESQ